MTLALPCSFPSFPLLHGLWALYSVEQWALNFWGWRKCSAMTRFGIQVGTLGRSLVEIFFIHILKKILKNAFYLIISSKLCCENLRAGFLREATCWRPCHQPGMPGRRGFLSASTGPFFLFLSPICPSLKRFCKRPFSASPKHPPLPLLGPDNSLKPLWVTRHIF